MGTNAKISTILSILAMVIVPNSWAAPTSDLEFRSSLDKFSRNMFTKLYESHGGHNIVYSPFSIQTCLTMARMAADGQTAAEMDQGLSFTGQSMESVADNYHAMLAKYEKSNLLNIANKVYVMKGYEMHDKFKKVLTDKFFSSAENIDFGQSQEAADAINSWVESKTNNAIKDLIDPQTLTSDMRLFLLSAIHFKGNWETPFDAKLTEEDYFYTDQTQTVKVQMMLDQRELDFAYYKDLNATAVRLPYKNSDLSMVIILPNARTGLAALEEKLRDVPLKSLTQEKFRNVRTLIHLPKFKAELQITLDDVLKEMGMKTMFSDAEFTKMLKTSEGLAIDTVIHKAFIDVNEVGTEAAATTGIKAMPLSMPQLFTADHPFYYIIMDGESVPLFQGTFVGV